MSHYILINRVQVQNANAIAGFTWGFPAITHFLGFTHNLTRKLLNYKAFNGINLNGCAVISHKQQVHTFGEHENYFLQSKNPAYLEKDVDKVIKGKAPSIIEEGKMNMTVSLLIGYEGNLGSLQDEFIKWLKNACMLQRLAGGTILDISSIEIFNQDDIHLIRRKLLPGFVLMDRSHYLESHYRTQLNENPNAELLDAWMDFITIKQKARPKSDLITKHFTSLVKNDYYTELLSCWDLHQQQPYDESKAPDVLLKTYFDRIEPNKNNQKLLDQWKNYCSPTDATESDWEYIAKPETGYLVPLMVGYKAISEVYQNSEVENTRDNKTPVCFVESVHSIGEWLSVHRLRTASDLSNCLWFYQYKNNWYLCKQSQSEKSDESTDEYTLERIINYEDPEDDFN